MHVLWIKAGETHLVVQLGRSERPRLGTVCGVRHGFSYDLTVEDPWSGCQLMALVSRVDGLKKAVSARKVWSVRTSADSESISRHIPARSNRTRSHGQWPLMQSLELNGQYPTLPCRFLSSYCRCAVCNLYARRLE